ncbi:MAG: helix-turn-helix domain-containing protein, partial [Chloroflexota bacterium]|nr:helix-turn-helix domain-containing protein [Chloroflexota bacterium]
MDRESSFGRWLKQRRLLLDLTQEGLAERVGCSVETVSKIERDARRPSRQMAERLAEVLEVPPDLQAEFVQRARLGTHDERQADASPLPPAPHATPTNLSPALTSFIGREQEQAEVRRLLAETRLLTLTGVGGTGKTRLALQVATQLLDAFPDGVFFVNLAPIRDPVLLIPTIAQTVAVREEGRQPLIERLKQYLQDKQMLLLLDNFEQILPAGPQVIELLTAASQLKVLITSRAMLGVSG